jgi:GNAT superfamily N-acetyltransferase
MIIDGPTAAYELDDSPKRIDRDAVCAVLQHEVYWGKWRSRRDIETQIDNSWRVVGVYERATGGLVGFARAVSDGVAIAYLADVFVRSEHRGHGLGVGLVDFMINGGPGAHFRWMLHTGDAHGLYAKIGFLAPDATFMERPGRAPDRD